MTITRYDPIEDLTRWRDTVTRLFEEPFAPLSRLMPFVTRSFAVDIYEHGAQYEISAALPGIDPKDVQVTTTKDTLTIKVAAPEVKQPTDGHYLRQERVSDEMVRVFVLPTEIVPDNVTCVYEHGMLTVTLPKAEVAKPQPIQIHMKDSVAINQSGKIPEKELVTTH